MATVSRAQIGQMAVQELQDIVNLQAGVVDGHFRGGRIGEVQYQVDGVSVNNAYDNKSTLRLDRSLLEEVQVVSGTFDADLAARAALRVGAGLVTVASPPAAVAALYVLLQRGTISRGVESEWLNQRLGYWTGTLSLLGDVPLTGAGLGMRTEDHAVSAVGQQGLQRHRPKPTSCTRQKVSSMVHGGWRLAVGRGVAIKPTSEMCRGS